MDNFVVSITKIYYHLPRSDTLDPFHFEGVLGSVFLQLTILPKLVSDNSTLIDNIFVNKLDNINFTSILFSKVSDHQTVAVSIDVTMPQNKTKYIAIYC